MVGSISLSLKNDGISKMNIARMRRATRCCIAWYQYYCCTRYECVNLNSTHAVPGTATPRRYAMMLGSTSRRRDGTSSLSCFKISHGGLKIIRLLLLLLMRYTWLTINRVIYCYFLFGCLRSRTRYFVFICGMLALVAILDWCDVVMSALLSLAFCDRIWTTRSTRLSRMRKTTLCRRKPKSSKVINRYYSSIHTTAVVVPL